MAILPYVYNPVQTMPLSSLAVTGDSSSQADLSEGKAQVVKDINEVAVSFFKRINSEYPGVDSENIKAVVSELITTKDETTLEFVRNQTIQQGVWWQRLLQIEAKTPLGEVLKEIQNAQESSGRKILPLQTFQKADLEAKWIFNGIKLLQKYPETMIEAYFAGTKIGDEVWLTDLREGSEPQVKLSTFSEPGEERTVTVHGNFLYSSLKFKNGTTIIDVFDLNGTKVGDKVGNLNEYIKKDEI